MDTNDGLEMDETSFLAIGRQGYGLSSMQLECHTTSNEWPITDFTGSSTNSKKIRVEEGGIWHMKSDALRSFSGEFSQLQPWPDSQRASHQTSMRSIQGCWNNTSSSSNDLDMPGSGFNRMGLDSEANVGHSASLNPSGCYNALETGPVISRIDFLQTDSDVALGCRSSRFPSHWVTGNGSEEVSNVSRGALIEDNMGRWHGVTGSGSGGVRVADSGLLMTCFDDGLSVEGRSIGDSMLTSMVQSPDIIIDNSSSPVRQNSKVQPPLNRILTDPHDTAEVENVFARAGVEDYRAVGPSVCSYSLSISGTEKRDSPLQAASLACSALDCTGKSMRGLEIAGGRSCKRKLSTCALVDGSFFEGSETSIKKEDNAARTCGRSGSSRPNPDAMSSSASPDPVSSVNNTSVIQIWDDLYDDRTGDSVGENDLFESIRSSTVNTADLRGTSGGPQRNFNHHAGSPRPERNRSQLHSLFASTLRRSMPSQQLHFSPSRRISSADQVCELGGMSAGITGGHSRSNSSAAASWGGNNSLLRGNITLPTSNGATVRERDATFFEGTRMSGNSGTAPSWMGSTKIEGSLASHASTSRGINSVTARATNSSEATVNTGQVDNASFYPGMVSSSQLAVFLSNRRSAGAERDVPPAMNQTVSFGFSREVPTPAGLYVGPSPSVSQPSPFLGGQGEGILAGPVHSILGMPFYGLHTLSADAEQRQRFLSEILSVLEHSRRGDEISLEELLVLDPSLIYGGLDLHDQHSDMRLDVDNMSYEELLALEERIGDVCTGLNKDAISQCLRESKYSSLDAALAAISDESDIKCSICQEEYVEEDEVGRLDCGHGYHTFCISQWLSRKNQCPICKSAAHSS